MKHSSPYGGPNRSRSATGRRLGVALAVAALAGTLLCACGGSAEAPETATDAAPTSAGGTRWLPRPTIAPWQWQLQGRIDLSVPAPVYEIDGFEAPSRVVRALHRRGRRVVCYIDVGSWERYRPDAHRFPRSAIGRRYEGYPDERWLDIRRVGALAPALRQRFDLCRRKGFDAVEPDNVNGFENPTGFPLTGRDQLRFNRWIGREVRRRGMAVALKNDPSQVPRLVSHFDFAVVEECFAYEECGSYLPFIRAGKAVFAAEYEIPPARFCARARVLRFSAIRKDYDLYAKPWRPCA